MMVREKSLRHEIISIGSGLHYNSVRLADDKKKMTTNILHYEDIRKLVIDKNPEGRMMTTTATQN